MLFVTPNIVVFHLLIWSFPSVIFSYLPRLWISVLSIVAPECEFPFVRAFSGFRPNCSNFSILHFLFASSSWCVSVHLLLFAWTLLISRSAFVLLGRFLLVDCTILLLRNWLWCWQCQFLWFQMFPHLRPEMYVIHSCQRSHCFFPVCCFWHLQHHEFLWSVAFRVFCKPLDFLICVEHILSRAVLSFP